MFNILEESKELLEELKFIRKELHQIPELDMDLPKSKAFIMSKLKEYGYEVEELGKSGMVTNIGNGEKTILLRADFDALPMVEETNLEYKSTNGSMHACGHDIHATMLLGTAKLLKKHEEELKCKVRLMFQPGEETGNGAKSMIEKGVLNGVDEAYMIHVISGQNVPSGKIFTTKIGPAMAASTYFKIDIKGQGAHGSTPFFGIDPINIANHTILNLQTITSREMNFFDPATISIGTIKAGSAYNVIPNSVEVEGTMRSFGKNNHNFIVKRLDEMVKQTAELFRGEASLEIKEIMPSLIQDEKLYLKTIDKLEKVFLKEEIGSISEVLGIDMVSGSEDFAFVSEKIPSLCLFLGLGTGEPYTLHHPKVTFDEEKMYMGVATFLNIVF